ncbi:MAG TPA: xanthine dehydrogenase family protein molybdopterin-binding subunit [Symbiobacteriaceae bacterium]|nr:xanthine dehydrogenase family protein molybdopterin-binding subunit [Symbiobacteriaceae bacterium]
MTAPEKPKKWVGTPMKRVEDRRLLTGKGLFMDDISPMPNMYHMAVVRSPYAHARILSINAAGALEHPGVVGVVTGEDFAKLSKPLSVGIENPPPYYPIAVGKARYVGEPVALVVARDRYTAEDAADLVEVEYDPLPAVVCPEAAAQPGAPVLHEEIGSNVVLRRVMRYGDPDKAFAGADFVLRDRFVMPKYGSTPLETFGVVANWNPSEGEYTIWANFHGPFSMHPVMAASLGVAGNRLRIITPKDIGGGFGIKTSIYPSMVMVAVAARKLGLPVKWIEDRREHLLSGSSCADRVAYCEVAFKNDGSIVGYKQKWYDNVGGYIRAPEPACSFRTHGNFVGPYKVRDLELDAHLVVTNKSLTGPNRGYGCQQLYFPMERLLDAAAEKLAIDPAEIRRRNLIEASQMPYTTPTGGVYDSGDYPATLQRGLDTANYAELRREQAEARKQGKLFGIGMALAVDPSVSNMGYVTIAYEPSFRSRPQYKPKGASNETCQIQVDPLGKVTVLLNSCPEGQGHETVAAQIVADELGISPKDINVISEFDTATRAWSITAGSYSSRFASVTSSAIAGAARKVREKASRIAAHTLGCAVDDLEWGNAEVRVKGTAKAMKFHHVCGLAHWNQAALPPGMEPGMNVTHTFAFERALPPTAEDTVQSSQTYGFIAEIVAVELDPETYKLKFRRYVSAHDAGLLLNPQIAEGQVQGSVAHGIGGALYEEMTYDADGQCLSGSFADYLVPTAMEIPRVDIAHFESPSPWTTLGSKGAGEASTETAPVAITAAVADALRPLGVTVREWPVSPSRLWTWVQEAKAAAKEATT